MKKIFSTLFLIMSSFVIAEEKPEDEAITLIKDYYQYFMNWEFKKLTLLQHPEYKEGMAKAMKIKTEEYDKTMISYLKKGMKLKYETHDEFLKLNKFKISNIELNNKIDADYLYIVTLTGINNGVKFKDQMKVFILKKHQGKYHIKDLVDYNTYMKFVNEELKP